MLSNMSCDMPFRQMCLTLLETTDLWRYEEKRIVTLGPLEFIIFLVISDRFYALLECEYIPHDLLNSEGICEP